MKRQKIEGVRRRMLMKTMVRTVVLSITQILLILI